MDKAQAVLTPKGERWRKSRHPWVYRDDLVDAIDPALSGQAVQVKSPQGQLLGQALYNSASKIALRWLTDDPEEAIDRSFWESRLQAALEYRRRVVKESTAYRLISSEADGFPGLVVDHYGSVVVLQSLSLGMERILPLLVEILTEILHPQAIIARNDSPVRSLEGLAQEKRLLAGNSPGLVEITEGDRRYLVDVWEGHKTGAYLDQRENRLWARRHARGRVLDAFSYQGGFTLHLAPLAEQLLALEDSESSVGILKRNLELNGIQNVQVERANVFDRLRVLEREGEKFDLIVLDPPAFARSRKEIEGAWRGYRELNLRALKILKPYGTLITCSCSYNMTDEIFMEILREASRDSQRKVRLIEIRTQSRDHPVVLTHPESKYLKCFALEVA